MKLKGLKYSRCNRLHGPLAKVLVGALFPIEALLAGQNMEVLTVVMAD